MPASRQPSTQSGPEDIDVSNIGGNISDEDKKRSVKVFNKFAASTGYGASVGQRFKHTEMNVWGLETPSSAYCQSVFELRVEPDMCDAFGVLHPACAAYIVDPCSVSSLVLLGRFLGLDGTGVSQSMNLLWHHPAKCGALLRIVSTSLFIHGRVRSARCEVRP
ncbi:hypothetical protein BD779DRAFT_1532320 [Infundibulicybe gibba]|nr:hypothetical protein BD779DRAFT_1532320 [Infundibulicybe gibba]